MRKLALTAALIASPILTACGPDLEQIEAEGAKEETAEIEKELENDLAAIDEKADELERDIENIGQWLDEMQVSKEDRQRLADDIRASMAAGLKCELRGECDEKEPAEANLRETLEYVAASY